MKKLMAVRRYLLLSVAVMPLMQAGGCALDPTIFQQAFTTQFIVLVNQLVASLFDLVIFGVIG